MKGGISVMREHKPIYPYSFAEAEKNGELELYRESHNENIACAQTIKKALADNFDGYHLKPGIEQKIIADFGFDRTMYVLANTIQHFNDDGRISIDNKDWADTIYIPDNHLSGINRNVDFLIDAPGLVNIFTADVRDRYKELNLWDSKHCIPPDGLNFENKVMVLKPEVLKDKYKTPDYQLFYCTGGFGCSPAARGRQVYGQFLFDAEKTHFQRQDFIGEIMPDNLPNWAKYTAMEIHRKQKLSVKKQLAEAPKQTEQKAKITDKGAR